MAWPGLAEGFWFDWSNQFLGLLILLTLPVSLLSADESQCRNSGFLAAGGAVVVADTSAGEISGGAAVASFSATAAMAAGRAEGGLFCVRGFDRRGTVRVS